MTSIIGISGSLRRGSFNTSLLRAANELVPDTATLTIESLAGIPLYNADDEAEHGVPDRAEALKTAIAEADGLLIATPEYNNSMPGVLKNAIDWMSRPPADIGRVFGSRPVAILGASPGGFGTVLAQSAWLPVLRTLGTRYFPGKLMVSGARKVFDENGALTDADVRQRLEKFLADFLRFIES